MTNSIVKKIKNKREYLNYSQEFMAEELGISQPAYANIESGKTKLNIERIVDISKILNIDLSDLLDNNYTINNFNNRDNSTAIGNVENLIQENKKSINKIIEILQNENSILRQENSKLITILQKKNL